MPKEVVTESLTNINVPVGLRQRKTFERTLKKNLTNVDCTWGSFSFWTSGLR